MSSKLLNEEEIWEEIERISEGSFKVYKDERSWVIYSLQSNQIVKRPKGLRSCLSWLKDCNKPHISNRASVHRLTNGTIVLTRFKNKWFLKHAKTRLILATANNAKALVDLVRENYVLVQSRESPDR